MYIYLVGGAVRDELLGLPVNEKDWLVTGTTPEAMIKKGYKPVGKDFPVFLHPETKEEYALARSEKKSGHGYGGFVFSTDPNISVEEDLLRRDFTINAIAKSLSGKLVDPFNGVQDIQNRILRHVSPAFIEDPLRVLRAARFVSQLADFGFAIDERTMQMMISLSVSGELEFLSRERIWQETLKAFNTPDPDLYFQTLYNCRALQSIFPEIVDKYFIEKHECHSRVALSLAAQDRSISNKVLFTLAFLPNNFLDSNSQKALSTTNSLLQRLKAPSSYNELLLVIMKHLPLVMQLQKPKAEKLFSLLHHFDAYRRKDRFYLILSVLRHLFGHITKHIEKISWLEKALLSSFLVDTKPIIQQTKKGSEIQKKIKEQRLFKIKSVF